MNTTPTPATPQPAPAPDDFRDHVYRIMRHDLKAPLNVILTAAEWMRDSGETLSDSQRRQLESILGAGRRMLDMIELAQAVTAIEGGTHALQAGPLDLLATVRDVLQRLRVLMNARQSAVTITVDGSPADSRASVPVLGERLLMSGLLTALIKNALEATPRGEQVTLDIVTAPAEVHATLANAGEVPDSLRGRFFHRQDSSAKSGGSGLGAYTARLLTEAQNGTIALDATHPGRTQIHLRLPRASTLS